MSGCAVVVIGIHRSGTSTLAGALDAMGVSMGTRFHVNRHANPIGHFEDLDFLTLNKHLLRSAGGDAAGLKVLPAERHLQEAIAAASDEIRRLIEQKSAAQHWGWKDPRTCLTIQAYEPFLDAPQYIIIRRNAGDVARSLSARDGMPEAIAMSLIEYYEHRVNELRRRVPVSQVLDVEYGSFRSEVQLELNRIAEFIELPISSRDLSRAGSRVLSSRQLVQAKRRVRRRRGIKNLARSVAGLGQRRSST